MARQYDRSPRQRTEWFGGTSRMTLSTNTTDEGLADQSTMLSVPPRIRVSGTRANNTAFPAGIVRGETCSVARFIGVVTVFDPERRLQNVSYELATGLIKQEVEDENIANPGLASVAIAPDPITDVRASWIAHKYGVFNPQSAGANYTVVQWQTEMDSTNSRVFESNEVMQWGMQARTLVNSGSAIVLNLRCTLQWRCLLRLD